MTLQKENELRCEIGKLHARIFDLEKTIDLARLALSYFVDQNPRPPEEMTVWQVVNAFQDWIHEGRKYAMRALREIE